MCPFIVYPINFQWAQILFLKVWMEAFNKCNEWLLLYLAGRKEEETWLIASKTKQCYSEEEL